MKRKLLVALAILAVACWVAPASANTITISTPTGATENGGNPVDAEAIITTGANGFVSITLENLLANPSNIAQCLSDFGFVLTSGSGGSLVGSAGQLVSMDSNGKPTTGSTVSTGWLFSQTGPSTFLLNDLGGGAAGPAHLIIGPAGPGNVYSNANASIAGNGPHNPLILDAATFTLNISGVTAATGVTSATFSFGTTAGDNVTVVPIPPTALLLGSGLLGLGLIGWRRKRG